MLQSDLANHRAPCIIFIVYGAMGVSPQTVVLVLPHTTRNDEFRRRNHQFHSFVVSYFHQLKYLYSYRARWSETVRKKILSSSVSRRHILGREEGGGRRRFLRQHLWARRLINDTRSSNRAGDAPKRQKKVIVPVNILFSRVRTFVPGNIRYLVQLIIQGWGK